MWEILYSIIFYKSFHFYNSYIMNNQSNIAIKFLNNLHNIEVIRKINDGDFHNKFLLKDKVTKEKYGIKIIPCLNDEYNYNPNSSAIYIYQAEEKEFQTPNSILIEEHQKKNNLCSADIKKPNNQSENKSDKNKNESNNNIFNYVKGHEFEGIFDHLNNINKSLANFKGLVYISSNGDERNHAFDLINKNFDDYFYPHPDENSFVKFDFKDHKVSLRNYSLRSKNVFFNKLINWEIEGSNDGIHWDKIDERHINEWYGTDHISTYSVNNHNFYQYVQIRLRGPASNNDYLLALTNIEFFGEFR